MTMPTMLRIKWVAGKAVRSIVSFLVHAWNRPAAWLDHRWPITTSSGVLLGDWIGLRLMRSDRKFVAWVYDAEHFGRAPEAPR